MPGLRRFAGAHFCSMPYVRPVGVAICCAPPNTAAAAPKISKKAVAYQDHPDGDKECAKCAQFQPPDACKMVEGPISPQGSCRIFVPVRQS